MQERSRSPIIIQFNEQPPSGLGIIFGDAWPYVKKAKGPRLQFIVGLKLISINGTSVELLEFAQAKDLIAYPLELAFSPSTWKSVDDFYDPIMASPEISSQVTAGKLKVLKDIYSYTQEVVEEQEKPIFYSAKWFWQCMLSLFNASNGCFLYAIDNDISDIYHAEENTPLHKYKKSVSLSLRCGNFTESALGVYLGDSPTITSSGKYNDWFEQHGDHYKSYFTEIQSEHHAIFNSRVMVAYTFINAFQDDYFRLTGNFGIPYDIENIQGDTLEQKVLFLNKSQSVNCDTPRGQIQGRLILDPTVIQCKIFFTPEQDALFNTIKSRIAEDIRRGGGPLNLSAEVEPSQSAGIGPLNLSVEVEPAQPFEGTAEGGGSRKTKRKRRKTKKKRKYKKKKPKRSKKYKKRKTKRR